MRVETDRRGRNLRTALMLVATMAGLFTVAVPSSWTYGEDLTAAALVLSSLGDPDTPLPDADARLIDAPYLGVRELREMHCARPGHAGA